MNMIHRGVNTLHLFTKHMMVLTYNDFHECHEFLIFFASWMRTLRDNELPCLLKWTDESLSFKSSIVPNCTVKYFFSDSWTFVNIVRVEWSNPWWFRFVYLTLMENTNSFENNFEHARTFMNIHEHPRANITVQAKIEPIRLVSIHIFIQIRKFDACRSVPR